MGWEGSLPLPQMPKVRVAGARLSQVSFLLPCDSNDAEAIIASIRDVTKLRGEVKLVATGSLPNDGKVIADERPVG